ncbi:MAG: His-Xaa-Ser system radical SAM maturase HxsB [Elusimicrobia bacterium]|nr:His-Xaa-Ser system radical SAM maturase HxsB [Elusimicrobiota bacterium]
MNYTLLPFRYHALENKIFLTNEVGEYIFLDKSTFDDLRTGNLSKDSKVFMDLKSQHFLTDTEVDPVIDLLAVKYRTKKSFLENFTSLHMVVPTLRCNSDCIYCQVSSKDNKVSSYDMDVNTAKNVVETIFKTPSKYIKIEFQGGEPLLNFDIVTFIIEYSNKLNSIFKKSLEFVICTNLTLVNSNMLNYLKKKNVYISTSLDGSKSLHNKNRILRNKNGSYDSFYEKLLLAKNVLGSNSISALMTTTKDSLAQPETIVNEYIRLGFSSIFVRMLNPFGLAKINKNELSYSVQEFFEFYKEILSYIIEINIKGKYFVEEYACLLLRRILTPFSTGFVDLQSPPGTGICGAIYNYNGNVFPSDEARMLSEMGNNRFLMGNVNKSSYEEIFYNKSFINLIKNASLETTPLCSYCAYQVYCGSDPIRNYSEQGDITGYKLNNVTCIKNRLILQYLIDLIEEKNDKFTNVFWSWITKRNCNKMVSN